jgi:hypothetical protein
MSNLVDFNDYRERKGYRIVITAGLWRGFDVTVEPSTATHLLRHAKTYNEAMALALAIQKAEGWPIFSNCGDDKSPGPEAA